MKILALEFSSPIRSVAVWAGTKLGYAEESGRRDTKTFALIDAALKEAGISREEIECIAIGLGPGSYAGIRIAIAIAQGWQLARPVKLLGLSSAEVVAAHAGQLGTPQSVWVALEARRGELYAAQYDATVLEQPKLVEPFHLLNEVERANDERNARLFRMDWSQPGKSEGVAFPPKADFLARLAAHRTNFIAGHELAPVYLRHVEFVKALPPKFGVL